ncbi:MAG TPA: methyltransferase domain-containing protein [Gemmatimonadaceae bacterium]
MTTRMEVPGPRDERTPASWNAVAGEWGRLHTQRLWRSYCDLTHTALIERWLPSAPIDRVLKTDLFDEIVTDGLYPVLARHAGVVVGMDVAASAASQARARHPALQTLSTDARRLPFADGSFDAIVSNSTLDHFETIDELVVALRELARITRRGGTLVLTLDNLANPVVALRSVLPQTPLRRLGLVPYYVGATCGPRRMCALVREAGFEVDQVETLMHCPRVFAVAAARVVDRYGSPALQRHFVRHLAWYDHLGAWPTRHLTSYFTAVRAVRTG